MWFQRVEIWNIYLRWVKRLVRRIIDPIPQFTII